MSGRDERTRRTGDLDQSGETATGTTPELSGPVAVPATTRGGEDTRRRGWFWHWNSLVTQYAPLIGLKGVGLLNSYTVWTDRREESPHRGYAFPSQQSEADFYGEDRAELITINKILSTLDLIEIRKEMVLRLDAQGRRWKAPHNFYRVKDHDDNFCLGAPDVLRVAELADRDKGVYRYVRQVFSVRFAPIDQDNVWSRILPEVRQTALWQRLAERTAAEEQRTSARARAGHAARKTAGLEPDSGSVSDDASAGLEHPDGTGAVAPEAIDFFAPAGIDRETSPRVDPDSSGVESNPASTTGETSVAPINTGSGTNDDLTNTGLPANAATFVERGNRAGQTSVEPGNSTYHQPRQTTTTTPDDDEIESETPAAGTGGDLADRVRETPTPAGGFGPDRAPVDEPGRLAAIRAFEEANDRPVTGAERRLLANLGERFEPAARAAGSSGWRWLAAAIYEAVEAGSQYVAPRRAREILNRWEREGYPQEADVVLADNNRSAPVGLPEAAGRPTRAAAKQGTDRDPAAGSDARSRSGENRDDLTGTGSGNTGRSRATDAAPGAGRSVREPRRSGINPDAPAMDDYERPAGRGARDAAGLVTADGKSESGRVGVAHPVAAGENRGLVMASHSGAPSNAETRHAAARDGMGHVPGQGAGRHRDPAAPDARRSATRTASGADREPVTLPPAAFVVAECGMTNGVVWQAVLAEIVTAGTLPTNEVEAWLRPARLQGRGGAGGAGSPLVIVTPYPAPRQRLGGRKLSVLTAAVERVLGQPVDLHIMTAREWLAREDDDLVASGGA